MARHGENIYKRKDGRYEGRYVIGKKSNGKTKFGYVFGYQYGDVKERLIQKKAERLKQAKPCVHKQEKTVAQWMRAWVDNDLRGGIKESSYQTYQNLLNRHILPQLGEMYLHELTVNVVRAFVRDLRSSGLSESTVRCVYRLFSAGIRKALDAGLIVQNPCEKMRVQSGSLREQRVLNAAEQRRLETALLASENIAALLAMYLGMRVGEICALKWTDVDWEQKTITVRRTVQRLKRLSADSIGKTHLLVGSPKSCHSHRTIPVPPFVLDRLSKLFASRRSNTEYIFSMTAQAAEPRTVQRRFARIVKSLGMVGVHFHTLRHPYVKPKTKKYENFLCPVGQRETARPA